MITGIYGVQRSPVHFLKLSQPCGGRLSYKNCWFVKPAGYEPPVASRKLNSLHFIKMRRGMTDNYCISSVELRAVAQPLCALDTGQWIGKNNPLWETWMFVSRNISHAVHCARHSRRPALFLSLSKVGVCEGQSTSVMRGLEMFLSRIFQSGRGLR